jgi:hypothetical protein
VLKLKQSFFKWHSKQATKKKNVQKKCRKGIGEYAIEDEIDELL